MKSSYEPYIIKHNKPFEFRITLLSNALTIALIVFLQQVGLTQCPSISGFTTLGESGSSCYYKSSSTFSWANANTNAQANGGHLAAINSSTENDFIQSNFSTPNPWIGFNDIVTEGTWVWSNDDPVTYTNWNTGEPNGGTSQNAAAFISTGKWNDAPEGDAKPYILEKASGLPVELIEFSVQENGYTVKLYWRTASELNNEGFQIQRSLDGENWDKLAFVSGHGTTLEEQSYSYTDERPLPGINYYRLRQMDFDGGEEYSKVVSVEAGFASNALTFFPNPAPEGITSFYFPEAPEGEGLLEVFDLLGNKVHRQAILLEGGSEALVPLDLHSFPSGMYVAALQIGGKVFSEKLMLKQ